jgi:tetratricopeptide (TPR) repeat protein
LSDAGQAEVRAVRPGHQRVVLASGAVELSVTPKRNGELLEVEAGGYLFRVVGTRFVVSLSDSSPHLDVHDGQVAVYQRGQRLALIGPGSSWDGRDGSAGRAGVDPEAVPLAPEECKPPSAEPRENCLALAREGSHQRALECFDRQSRHGGLEAEVALYEGARLRRDVLGDLDGALSALRAYIRRFPNGAFFTEASITIVEIEAARGNAAAALAESARIVESGNARERTSELRMLRGHLREQRGEYAQAMTEYAGVIEQNGPLAEIARKRLEVLTSHVNELENQHGQ